MRSSQLDLSWQIVQLFHSPQIFTETGAMLVCSLLAVGSLALSLLAAHCDALSSLREQTYLKLYHCDNSTRRCLQATPGSRAGHVLQLCRIMCDRHASIWPRPTGFVATGQQTAALAIEGISFAMAARSSPPSLLAGICQIFRERLRHRALQADIAIGSSSGLRMALAFDISQPRLDTLDLSTDESYQLKVRCDAGAVAVEVAAETVFGARHALETLGQLVAYDAATHSMQVVCESSVSDRPAYAYRGLLVDTARHFFSVASLRRTLDGMAFTKLNRLHWHISDHQSFPLQLLSLPQMAWYGAYDSSKVYRQQDVLELAAYARLRGVAIVPEIDSPSHVGHGWEWGEVVGRKGPMLLCFDKHGVGPPSGYLNPANEQVFETLSSIYREVLALFPSTDLFHLGGDEVTFACWENSTDVTNWMRSHGIAQDRAGFFRLWAYFQERALSKLLQAAAHRNGDKPSKEGIAAVLWSSSLTTDSIELLQNSSESYVVESWEASRSTHVLDLLRRGFRVIVSPYDVWYLDCGYASWVGDGLNWCSPFKGWQTVYSHRPDQGPAGSWVISDASMLSRLLGGEVSMWSEQADEHNVDSKIWPRASAAAERLWSNPAESWREANERMQLHRERLVHERHIGADVLQPHWCLQNEGYCLQAEEDGKWWPW